MSDTVQAGDSLGGMAAKAHASDSLCIGRPTTPDDENVDPQMLGELWNRTQKPGLEVCIYKSF